MNMTTHMDRTLVASLALLALLAGCSESPATAVAEAAHGEESAAEVPKGPHGGRLLTDGAFAVEVTIFERGVPPEFRVFATQDGKPVDPATINLSISLARLGGRTDGFEFKPQGGFLLGNAVVEEPHSFDVTVAAEVAGQTHRWNYESYESRTSILPDAAKSAGAVTAVAGPATLREYLPLYGQIQPNAERVRNVVVRFPGVVRTVHKQIGDAVQAGETLATVESNESLQTYSVTAPIAGVVTQRATNPGESAGAEPIFVIADFSSVWAELSVFPRDRARLRAGQEVTVTGGDGAQTGKGKVAYISPVGGDTQSLTARVVLNNSQGQWTPGLFITGKVTTGESRLPLAVKNSGLQSVRDWTVVFLNVGDQYEARPLQLGRTDGDITEVLEGLKAGDHYVAENSYLIKADIEKSGASHDH